MNKANCLI